ncbi:MAG: cyclic nucleotide-binding domain-containing protein [Planctomycetes bacterium]|nr:cyclic nucleotide-binding domain-containing protein [Planctomycetota bacterium]
MPGVAPKAPGAPPSAAAPAGPKAPGLAPPGPKAPGAAPAPAAAAAPAAPPVDKNSPEYLVSQIPLFKGVSPTAFRFLREGLADESVQFRVLGPKAVVCREGEYTADFFVLLSGMVGVYKQTEGGPKYLTSLTGGTWFGEMSCMSNAPRAATVIAEADTVVLSIPRHTFMRLYADKASAGFKKTIDDQYRDRALQSHLAGVSLFRGIRDRVLKQIADVAELVVAEKGSEVIREGGVGDAFFLVRTGHAKVTKSAEGREEILAWVCENSFFGEVALLTDQPRRSTVTAVDRMDLVRIPKEPFLALLAEHADVKATVTDRLQRIFDTEFLTEDEAAARGRAREIGAEHEVVKAGEALVIDMSKCTRCNMCVTGCIEAHEDRIPRIGKRGLSYGELLLTSSCYNCQVPDCMLACKFGAIRRDRRGQVNIDPLACTGCSLCEPACPYGTIHMQSLVGVTGVEVIASPMRQLLSTIPVIGGIFKAKKPEPAPATAEKKDEPKGPKARAVKCDLCAGRGDMACIYNCPCGAIERIDPTILLGGT